MRNLFCDPHYSMPRIQGSIESKELCPSACRGTSDRKLPKLEKFCRRRQSESRRRCSALAPSTRFPLSYNRSRSSCVPTRSAALHQDNVPSHLHASRWDGLVKEQTLLSPELRMHQLLLPRNCRWDEMKSSARREHKLKTPRREHEWFELYDGTCTKSTETLRRVQSQTNTLQKQKHSGLFSRCARAVEQLLLPRVSNLHYLRGLAPGSVEHLEGVLIVAEHAQHCPHRDVRLTRARAARRAFLGDDFVPVLSPAFGEEGRGLDVAEPDALESLLRVVVTRQVTAFKWPAHHFTVEFLLEKTPVQYPLRCCSSLAHLRLSTRLMPALHLRLPISHQRFERFVPRPRSARFLHLPHHLLLLGIRGPRAGLAFCPRSIGDRASVINVMLHDVILSCDG